MAKDTEETSEEAPEPAHVVQRELDALDREQAGYKSAGKEARAKEVAAQIALRKKALNGAEKAAG